MTIAVDWGVKHQFKQTNKQTNKQMTETLLTGTVNLKNISDFVFKVVPSLMQVSVPHYANVRMLTCTLRKHAHARDF